MDGYIVYVLMGVMPQRSFECNDIVLFEYFAKKNVRPYVIFIGPFSHSGPVLQVHTFLCVLSGIVVGITREGPDRGEVVEPHW